MATYKKRGYKPKAVKEDESVEEFDNSSLEENSTTAGVFNTLDETASKTEEFVAKNQKFIFIIIGIVAVTVLGFSAYQELIAKPKQTEAMNQMYQAQKHFNDAASGTSAVKDSLFTLSINGDKNPGMLDIIDTYSGTPAANLANYYVGTAYLNLKDYVNAIEYLDDFKSDDEILAPLAKGNIGDAYVQLDQLEDALPHYEKAIKMRSNNYTAPLYLYKAGIVALELGQTDKALNYFKTIKKDYSKSSEATNIDAFIGKAEALASK